MQIWAHGTLCIIHNYCNSYEKIKYLPKGGDVGKVTGSADGVVGVADAIGVIGFVKQYSLRLYNYVTFACYYFSASIHS